MKNKALVILGPTASGKTSLALNLARHLKIEIISLDSALIYKGMDIGTAKPAAEEQRGIPHHLIDFLDPGDEYSVVQYGSQSDWELITGADTAEYEIKSVKAKEGYHCKVSDGVKEFDLDFNISVGKPLSVKAEGAKENESNTARLYADEGSTLTLRAIVSADDGSQLKYKWSSGVMEWDEEGYPYYSGFETIEGADKAEYLIEYAEESLYKCTVSDQYGNSARAKFFICMDSNLHAYAEGGDERESYLYQTIRPHEDVKLRVIAAAGDLSGITYQWQEWTGDDDFSHESYEDIEGANEDSYRPDIAESKEYRCVVSDQYISVGARQLVAPYDIYAIGEASNLYSGITMGGSGIVFQIRDLSGTTCTWDIQENIIVNAASDEDIKTDLLTSNP